MTFTNVGLSLKNTNYWDDRTKRETGELTVRYDGFYAPPSKHSLLVRI